MKKIRSKFLTFLLCASLLVPSIPAQAKLNIIDEHNAVDIEAGLQHVNYPSMTTYLVERNKILSGIDAAWSTERKLLYIHDYIVLNTEYDYERVNGSNPNGASERVPSTQAYGPIVTHKAICQGYADAFLDLATHIGVPTIRVSNKGHAWNAVQLNGEWYYVDCTNDDSSISPRYCSHENFLKSEAAMRKNGHSRTFYHQKLIGSGNDMANYHQDIPINGKCTSTIYDNMSWHGSTFPVVSLKDGSIIYYSNSDNGIYQYKCDGKTPQKLVDMYTVVNQYTKASLKETDYITGNDSKIVFHGTGNEWTYSINKKTIKLTSGKAKLINEKEKVYTGPKAITKGSKFISGGITYKITGSKTVSVNKISSALKKVSIPDGVKYCGKWYKITAIDKNAAKNGNIKEIWVGPNIKTIGQNAFYQCPLKNVILECTEKNVLKSVGKNAFKVKKEPNWVAIYHNTKKRYNAYVKMLSSAGLSKYKDCFGEY